MSDEYRIVTARVKRVRPNSFFIERPRAAGEVSIPRSLIHSGDDMKIDGLRLGSEGAEFTFRLREWKAEEVGLS